MSELPNFFGGPPPLNRLSQPELTVENVVGSGRLRSISGSFLEYYIRATRQPFHTCAAAGCWAAATVGGHVRVIQPYDPDWKLLPLCSRHNAQNVPYAIKFGVILVPARGAGTY